MFTRQEVCALAAIPVERFKTMIRRDQLPSVHSDAAKDSYRFSAEAAFTIAIQESLSREIGCADGLSLTTASRIVAYNREIIR